MSVTDLKPEQKAAALVVAVGSRAASNLLQFLSEEEVEALASEVAKIGRLRPETIDGVMQEVLREAEAQRNLAAGGIDYAKELLSEWQGSRGAEIIDRLMADLNVVPFNFIRDIDPEQLVHILKDEHPQTVALILAHQPAGYAARVLSGFDYEFQAEIALRVGTMGRTSPDVIRRVETALRERLGTVSQTEVQVRGGVQDLAEVLNNTDRSTEKAILERLMRVDPDLAEEVRALMFVFEDIATLEDKFIQKIIQEVDAKELAMAMKGVAGEVQEAITRNMSQRAAETLGEELELLGAVRRADVEAAQSKVVAIVRRLEDAGEIVIARAGESDLIE
jgi:flagellar motor switch protein FliG